MLRIVLTVIFIIVCLGLVVSVLSQEAKANGNGLGSVSGSEDTYWSKNKERTREGFKLKAPKYLGIAFMVLAAILNISRF